MCMVSVIGIARVYHLNMNHIYILCRLEQRDILSRYREEHNGTQGMVTARSFMGYPLLSDKYILVATPRDPCMYEYIGAVRNTSDEKASIMTINGASWLSPEEYMELAGLIGADIVVAMGDEVVSDSKGSRIVTSSKRTIQWMKRCLDVRKSYIGERALLLCPIVGGDDVSTREDAYKYIHDLAKVADGIYISGLGTGEGPGSRLNIIRAIVGKAPPDKLRMVSGISTPGEVLQAVAAGIDVFDTSFVSTATRSGYALNFSLHTSSSEITMGEQSHVAGMDGTKINLWSDVYMRDKSPLVAQCACDTCRNHTRAYIHHLLVTHEMTAQVLLEHHNIFHMLSFFQAIRASIEQGRFQEYLTQWIDRQRQWQQCAM